MYEPAIPEPTADIRDRLRYLISLSRHTQAAFAGLTDTDPAVLSRILAGKQKPGDAFINRVVMNMGVSKEWLVSGRDVPFPKAAVVAEPAVVPEGAPVYDVNVMAGPVPISRMLTEEHIVGRVNLPGLSASTPLVPVCGDSMMPRVRPGALVAIRPVSSDVIAWGQIYVVVLDDYRMLKYVRRHSDPAKVVLHSANPNYDDMDVDRDQIRALYIVERVIDYEMLC